MEPTKKTTNIRENIRECILWFAIWHSILLVPVFGLWARGITVFFWFICMILLFVYFISKNPVKKYIKKYYLIFVILCTISLFSPIDLRFAPNWKNQQQVIMILPVVSTHAGYGKPFRDMRADNKKAFKDYVPNIVSGTPLTYPKYAIVIFYPSRNILSKPLKESITNGTP
jgi:hypothetical protein